MKVLHFCSRTRIWCVLFSETIKKSHRFSENLLCLHHNPIEKILFVPTSTGPDPILLKNNRFRLCFWTKELCVRKRDRKIGTRTVRMPMQWTFEHVQIFLLVVCRCTQCYSDKKLNASRRNLCENDPKEFSLEQPVWILSMPVNRMIQIWKKNYLED